MKTKPNWSKQPEGYPLWLESVLDASESCWVREEADYYTNEDGLSRGKWLEMDGSIIVHHRPEPVAWDGEGDPPVGLPVYWFPNGSDYREVITVLAYHGGEAWIKQQGKQSLIVGRLANCEPIPTPEQKAAQKRERAIEKMVHTLRHHENNWDGCADLYDQGYRKIEVSHED